MSPGEPLPDSLRDTLLARVEARSTIVRDVLRIAAVAGRTVDHALLATVSELSEDDLTGALREAVENYLLAPDSATVGYSFRHALLREAIYSDLLPAERRNLHLTLARTLSAQPTLAGATDAGAAELAHHWYAAGDLPAALTAFVRAGVAAEDLCAPGEAWEQYERALEIWDRVAPAPGELPLERLEVLRRAAEAALMTGEEERAISLANDVLARIDEHHDPIGAALAYERLGRYLWIAGRDEEALLAYRRAVELMPDDPPSEERALVLAAEGQALMLCDRTTESNSRCAQALAIARSVGAEAVEAHVLNTMCGNLSAIGQFDQAVRAASQARAIAGRLRLADEIHRSYTNGGGALYQAGRVEESIAVAREGIASAGEFGVERHWGDFLRGELAGRLVQLGRWREAERLLEEVIDRSPTGVHAGMAYRCLGYLQVGLGEFDAAARALDRAEQHTRRSLGSMTLAPPAVARASLELWAGRPQAAAAVVSDCLQRVGDGEHVFFTARLYELGARACADLAARAPGDDLTKKRQTVTAERLLERLDGLIARITGVIPPVVLASRAACAAEYSRIGGAGDAALWADARRHRETCTNPYQAAYARWREAEALLASGGDRADVEALVRDAHAVADELDAQPLRGELETLARRARIELAHDGPPEPAPNAAVERLELTPREIDVLGLARRRADQPRDRRRAVHQRQDRERARLTHPDQALGPQPRGRRRGRAPPGPHTRPDRLRRLARPLRAPQRRASRPGAAALQASLTSAPTTREPSCRRVNRTGKRSSTQAKTKDKAPGRWQRGRLHLAWTHRPTDPRSLDERPTQPHTRPAARRRVTTRRRTSTTRTRGAHEGAQIAPPESDHAPEVAACARVGTADPARHVGGAWR